ncbi:hypothetical protein EUGRSUZ_J01162 [Eucalyptus grandis]|uniref:Uncharacterized protein n=2 Tax=Eucalyptus grandis TaxID=71139 RepID=A0ACC3J4A2_EUCGR|nr:hypothetical protein EUGRSUZ_J01162 [Eucalyptus grandis]
MAICIRFWASTSLSELEFVESKESMAWRRSLTEVRNCIDSLLLSWKREGTVLSELFKSHLVMMDSAFSMFSSIMDSENVCLGVS